MELLYSIIDIRKFFSERLETFCTIMHCSKAVKMVTVQEKAVCILGLWETESPVYHFYRKEFKKDTATEQSLKCWLEQF